MEMFMFEDMRSLVTALKSDKGMFPEHVDRSKAINDIEKYYVTIFKNHKFGGKLKIAKMIAAKLPSVKKAVAHRVAVGIMNIYPQSRCDAYRSDLIEDILAYGDKYIEAYELLDQDSKKMYLDLLLLRLTGDFAYIFPHYNSSKQYFSEKIQWKKHPNVVDCGAYIGDTFLAFYDMGIIPNHYFLYELDDENYNLLLGNVKNKNSKVHPRKKGIYSENTIFYYEADRDSSRLVSYETSNKVEVVALDNDVDVAPDFIKMDIEGGEVPAIKGGADLIRKYHPILAICIYHLKDDFWKISLLIHEICPEYRHYWIEHYSLGYNETVLFVSM